MRQMAYSHTTGALVEFPTSCDAQGNRHPQEREEATSLGQRPAPLAARRPAEGKRRLRAACRSWSAQARRAGIRAVLRSDATAAKLGAAVAATPTGLVVLHPDALTSSPAPVSGAPDVVRGAALTPRELEILGMMAEGLRNRAIATHLGISGYAVKLHVASILAKLGAASRTEAVTLGVRHGLISL